MRFSCTQENLLHGLILTSRIASRAGNLPILSNIHISARQDGIMFKATNLEIGLTVIVRGVVDEEGEFTAPAKLLTDYVAFLPKDTVAVALKNGALAISCGKHKTAIKGMPAAEFPLIPAVENGETWNVTVGALREGLDQVLLAISPTETRPEISGAFLQLDGKTLTLAGTDSYRLAEKKILAESTAKKGLSVIAPLRALQELSRILTGIEPVEVVKLTVSSTQLSAQINSTEFVSRLIDGQYPDYKAIVPDKFAVRAELARSELVSALKTAGLFSKAGVYDVALTFDTSQNQVSVRALNTQTGEHESDLEAEVAGAGPLTVAFNWKYLLDGAQAILGERVVLKAGDSAAPTKLEEKNSSDYFYLVMPIKE